MRPSLILCGGSCRPRPPLGRVRQAHRLGCRVTRCALLIVSPDTLGDVPSFCSNRCVAALRAATTLFVGWRDDAGKAHLSRAPSLMAIRFAHRTSNVHRGLRWVAPPAPPLLRVVCSASVVAASSRLPAVECRPRPVALSLLPPSNPPPPPPVPPSHTPRGDNNRLGHFLSAGASHCGARLRPRLPL